MTANKEKQGSKIHPDERELIERCQAGQQSGYEDFYRQYSVRVYNLACRVLGDTELAKDAVQEIFVKTFRGLNNFQYQSKISTWLYQITANHCRDMLRSQARRKDIPDRPLNEDQEEESLINRAPDQKPTPRKEQENQELRQKVIEAMNRLPVEFREAIYLKEIEDMSYKEISKILGCRMGTVKSRIFRARVSLQTELRDLYQEITGGQ